MTAAVVYRHIAVENANILLFESHRPEWLLVFTPALGVRAEYYADFAHALTRKGFTVAVNELRGHGLSPVVPRRGADFGYSALINEDLRASVDHLARHLPDLPLVLGGHSLGGHLAALYAARYQPLAAGLVLIASGSPFYRAFPPGRARTLYWGSFVMQAVSALIGYFPGKTFGFGGREARRLMDDWSRIARHNVFNFDGDPFDYDGTLAAVGCPVLALCFPGDDYAPAAAVRRFTDKLPQQRVHFHLLDEPAFERTHHFSWVRQGERLAPLLGAWLARVAA